VVDGGACQRGHRASWPWGARRRPPRPRPPRRRRAISCSSSSPGRAGAGVAAAHGRRGQPHECSSRRRPGWRKRFPSPAPRRSAYRRLSRSRSPVKPVAAPLAPVAAAIDGTRARSTHR
jgi:hypothetical protein